jgi:adenylate cyclase
VSTGKTEIDFEAEGLLEGLKGKARDARLELLRSLAADGVSVEELRAAIAQDRLVLMPVERVLAGELKYTIEEVADAAGIDIDVLTRQMQASGLPIPEPGEVALGDGDVEMATRIQMFRDAGLPDEGIREIARVIGMSMARLAETNQQVIGEAFLEPGDTERDAALRWETAARVMTPLLGRTMEFLFARHLRESIRQAVISEAVLESGRLPGSSEVTVAFADLVGFTRLGEGLEAGEIGELSGRLTELATAIARPPVRLVKMIGDAAMLVSAEAEPLLEATLELVEAVEANEKMPSLRAGVARGEALGRAGDWYGRPVNLASRLTGFARPGTVVVDEALRETLDGDDGQAPFAFSFAGKHHFKGIKGEAAVFRAKRKDVSNG